MLRDLPWTWAGRLPFPAAVERNLRAAELCRAGQAGQALLFEPTSPLFTLGRRAATSAGRARLAPTLALCAQRQIEVLPADRGGLGTLHLPGQLVCFIAQPCRRSDLPRVVRKLFEGAAGLARARGLGVRVDLSDDAGLWLETGKLASVGLRLERGVVCHGMALNVAIDRDLARGLTLCGHDEGGYANLLPHRHVPPEAGVGTDRRLAQVACELAERLFAGPGHVE